MVNSIEIEYLEPKNEFRVGSVKNIAVPSNNKDDIKKMYPNSKKTESNADMLSQSFNTRSLGTPMSNNTENMNVENASEPVQISPIPVVQNSNLEATPVSLDMSVLSAPEIQPQEPIVISEVTQEPVVENVSIEPTNISVNKVPEVSTPVFESGFKVSDAPNIFDNPAPVNPVESNTNVVGNSFTITPSREEETKESDNISDYKPDINDDIISLEIAILEKNVKLYEELAENNRKFIELKKKQIKKEENEVNLENTASNLFNNKGILDENQVLGDTPMPSLKIA